MEVRSFNCELGVSNILFKRLFSNIKIEKVDASGNKKDVVVNCQFGQRSRILKSWQNAERKAMIKLPMIVINRTGYSRDSGRVNNLHNEVKYEITSKNRLYDYLTPVPVNISYEVTILSKWQKDIDQIASNFMVFFNSSLYVSCVHPKYDGIKLNNQVIMEDSVSEDHPDEIDAGTDDFITTTFNFTFKTFLFGGVTQAKKRHHKVLSSYEITSHGYELVEFDDDDEVRKNLSSFDDGNLMMTTFHTSAEVESFLEIENHSKVSGYVITDTVSTVTSIVENPDISDDVYEEFAPIINQINVGFYPVPMMSSIPLHMKEVDQYAHEFYEISGYISCDKYGRETSGVIDSYDTIHPYVDRLIWRIDSESTNPFPDNIYSYRDMMR